MKGSAVSSGVAIACGRGEQIKSGLAKAIEEAMAETIAKAYEEGFGGDTEEIARRMAETRTHVRDNYAPPKSNPEG